MFFFKKLNKSLSRKALTRYKSLLVVWIAIWGGALYLVFVVWSPSYTIRILATLIAVILAPPIPHLFHSLDDLEAEDREMRKYYPEDEERKKR